MKKYIYFWGCQVPARFPFIEKATRLALEILGIDAQDAASFTCCPERYMAQSMGEEVWLLTAIRNLALAETAGGDVLITPCNGCYASFRSAARQVRINTLLGIQLNQTLKRHNLGYYGRIKVRHILELLAEDIGGDTLSRKLKAPLWGMKIAVHYGCHLLRPGEAAGFDDPQYPTKFEALIRALGATSLDYPSKLLCCGESLGRGTKPKQALDLARRKLLELQELGADAICVACPACFLQYDTQQFLMRRQGDEFNIPVFHYSELLGLSLGLEPKELGFGMHRIKTDEFLDTWRERCQHLALIEEYFDLEALKRCHQCKACENDCPAALNLPDFSPQEIIGQVLEGRLEELLSLPAIWNCVECHTCGELCPQKFGMEQVFTTLKQLAVSQNMVPDTLKSMLDSFKTTGGLGQPQATLRKRLNLPQAKANGLEEWKRFLEKCKL
jgi:CoB--CoM heterodisulfide reductase subunit B